MTRALRSNPLCLVVPALLAACAWGADWPQWRGPNRDGVSAESNWSAEWDGGGPKVLWRASVGAGFSSAVIRGGRLYTMGGAGDVESVVCLDALTGREIWKHSYACPAFKDYPGPQSTPCLDGNALYAVGRAGRVHALDAATGKVLWSVEPSAVEQLKWDIGRQRLDVCASPLIDGKHLVVNFGGGVVAFDKSDGTFLWKDLSAQGGFASPVIQSAGTERCLILFGGGRTVGLDPATGRKLWEHPWKCTANAADAVVSGNDVFITSGYGKGCALLRPARGAVEAVYESKVLGSHFASPVRREGHVFGFDGNTGDKRPLVCVELATGAEKWRHHGLHMGTLILAGGRLVILTETGELVVVEASPKEYRELARAKVLDGRCWTAPALSGGVIYCRNEKGEIVALDVRK